jgi:hypothetical protein
VTVLRLSQRDAHKLPTDPQNIIFGPCRAVQFGEDIKVRGNPACAIIQMERRS